MSAKVSGSMGDQVAKMAKRTGLSVEMLDALGAEVRRQSDRHLHRSPWDRPPPDATDYLQCGTATIDRDRSAGQPWTGAQRPQVPCTEKQFKLLLNRIANGVGKIERNTRPLCNAQSRCQLHITPVRPRCSTQIAADASSNGAPQGIEFNTAYGLPYAVVDTRLPDYLRLRGTGRMVPESARR